MKFFDNIEVLATGTTSFHGNFIVTGRVDTSNYLLKASGYDTVNWASCLLSSTDGPSINWGNRSLMNALNNANLQWSNDLVKINTTNSVADLCGADSQDFRIATTANGTSGKGIYLKAYSNPQASWRTGLMYLNSGSEPNLYLVPDGFGNVGVGMTGGTHKLNVNGNIGLSGISNTYNIGVYEILKISQGSGAINISLGNNNTIVDADNGGAIAIGTSVLAASDGIAIGLNASATTGTIDGIAIGRAATVSNGSIRGIAIGREASVTASNAFAIGNYTTASQDDTIILGNNSLGNKSKVGIWNSTPTATLDISGATGYNQFRMRTSFTPTGTTDGAGNTGDLAWDADYLYMKTGAGWKRSGLATW